MNRKIALTVPIILSVVLMSSCTSPTPPPKTILLAAGQPCGIAVDSTYVYWTEGCDSEESTPDGKIWKVPINEGEAVMIANGLKSPAKIAVYADNVYWTQWGLGLSGQMWKMSVDGGQKFVVGHYVDFSHARPIMQGNYVYWTNGDNVMRAHVSGGGSQQEVTHLPDDPAYDVRDFTLDSGFVYYSRWLGGMIEKWKIDPNNYTISPSTLAMNFADPNTGVVEEHPVAIAIDGTYVYWGEHASNTGTIKRVNKTGGTVETLAQSVKDVYDLSIDGTYVYWTDDSGVHKTLKDGTGPIINIDPSGARSDIVITNGMIFWGDPGKGVYVHQP